MKKFPVWYLVIFLLIAAGLVVWSLLARTRNPAAILPKERDVPINRNKFGDEESFEYKY